MLSQYSNTNTDGMQVIYIKSMYEEGQFQFKFRM